MNEYRATIDPRQAYFLVEQPDRTDPVTGQAQKVMDYHYGSQPQIEQRELGEMLTWLGFRPGGQWTPTEDGRWTMPLIRPE